MIYAAPAHFTVISLCDALLDRLETPAFDAEIHLASGFAQARRAAQQHAVVRALVEQVRSQPEAMLRLLARIEDLSERAIDSAWASPHEALLLALLEVIDEAAPSQRVLAATHALKAPNAPWAHRRAGELLHEAPVGHAFSLSALPRTTRLAPLLSTESSTHEASAYAIGKRFVKTDYCALLP